MLGSSWRRRGAVAATVVVTTAVAAAGAGPATAALPPIVTAPLTVTAPDAGSATMSWPNVSLASTVEVWRDGTLVDSFPATGAGTYTDRGLWQSTAYTYSVRVQGTAGLPLARYDGSVTTPPRVGAFPRLYDPASFVNTPIGATPAVDPNSAAMVSASITPYVGGSNVTNDADWGIPIFHADTPTRRYTVGCTKYWCDVSVPPFPIPGWARPSSGGDAHMVVLDDGSNGELDTWLAEHVGSTWRAGVRTVIRSDGSGVQCAPGAHCGRPNAAGFALAAGIVRPEEIAQGHIDHALMITTPYTRSGYVACPAIGTDGSHADPNALPMGAHLQLDPAVNVDGLSIPAWEKAIAHALQDYGAYVVDTGGSMSIRAESSVGRGYDAWAKVGVPDFPYVSNLPWGQLRVLKLTQCA
jgi:hypothetical protein